MPTIFPVNGNSLHGTGSLLMKVYTYYLDIDPEIGAIIRGNYDYDSGDWAHRYIITDLTQSLMTWTAKDDPGFVQIWNRVDSIPVAAVAEE